MRRAGLGNMGHKLYIFKIAKQIHGKNAISQPPGTIVNNFVNNYSIYFLTISMTSYNFVIPQRKESRTNAGKTMIISNLILVVGASDT